MNQYQIVNAGHLVDGYFMPHPGQTEAEEFERAKAETIKHQQDALANIQALTLQQFKAAGFQTYEATVKTP